MHATGSIHVFSSIIFNLDNVIGFCTRKSVASGVSLAILKEKK